MAFRINSNIVVNNSRRADIEDLYLIPYTQSQLESNPGSAVGDMAYCSDASGGKGQLVFWNGTEWSISVPPVIQSYLELYLDSHKDIGTTTRWDSSSPGFRNLFLGNAPGTQSSSTPKYRTFNGSDQYGTDNDSYNLEKDTNFTWEAWFRSTPTYAGPGGIGPLVGFYGLPFNEPGKYGRFVYLDTSGRLNFGIYTNGYSVITTSAVLGDGYWHHFAATYDGTTMNLYVDNTHVGSMAAKASDKGTFYTNIGAGRNTTWPGATNNEYTTYTKCDLSIVRLYFNKALTQSEVTNNYDADRRKFS